VYKELGLPFFDLWRDEGKKAGVAGKWNALTGVAEHAAKTKLKGKKRKRGVGGKEEGGDVSVNLNENVNKGEGFREISEDFPVVKLLDVDDTVPVFRSVVDDDDFDFDDDDEGNDEGERGYFDDGVLG
jgi:hypothetical protein